MSSSVARHTLRVARLAHLQRDGSAVGVEAKPRRAPAQVAAAGHQL